MPKKIDTDSLLLLMANHVLLESTESLRFLGMHLGWSNWSYVYKSHFWYLCNTQFGSVLFCRSSTSAWHIHTFNIFVVVVLSTYKLNRVFRLGIIAKFTFRESCVDAFRGFGLPTLPWLYIFKVAIYIQWSNRSMVQGVYPHLLSACDQKVALKKLDENLRSLIFIHKISKRLLVSTAF